MYGCKPTKCYVCRVPITYGAREWVLVCDVRVWDESTGYIEVQAKIRFLRNNTGGGSQALRNNEVLRLRSRRNNTRGGVTKSHCYA